VHVFEEDQ